MSKEDKSELLKLDGISNILAFNQISQLFNDGTYLPFTDSSLNFNALSVILNDIVINERKTIIEFGSGISTIIIAMLIKKNHLENVNFTSVEHDINWFNAMQTILLKRNLSDYVNLINADLVDSNISINNNKWYDQEVLLEVLKNKSLKVDCLIVDGPPAYYAEVALSRYPALPFLLPFMNEKCSIFLDDTNRKGEQIILEKWISLGFVKEHFSRSFTGLFKGEYFNIRMPKSKI